MSNDTPTIALLAIHAAAAYTPGDVTDTMTARDLLEALQELIEEHGDDVLIVTRDGGNMYGAAFGAVSTSEDTFTVQEPDEECETCGAMLSDEEEHDDECPQAVGRDEAGLAPRDSYSYGR